MTLAEHAAELRRVADEYPFDPLMMRPIEDRHRGVVDVEGWPVRVTFTRTRLAGRDMYQLSISLGGKPHTKDIAAAVKEAFLPTGVPIDEVLPVPTRWSTQFVQFVEDPRS